MPLNIAGLAAAVAFILVSATAGQSAPVKRVDTTVNGVQVWRYEWTDSQNRLRTMSLKKQGAGNTGNGGYAVQATYRAIIGGVLRTVTVNAKSGFDGGFGYFVSHESYRTFTDGSEGTIAGRVFKKDDSPLGRGFPVTESLLSPSNTDILAHRFRMTYPRYGTKDPIPWNSNGRPVSRTPIEASKNQLYSLPVTITWVFQNGRDHPRIQTAVSLGGVPKADLVNFDLRGPYGVMDFDNGLNNPIRSVIWGDRHHFKTSSSPVTRNSAWTWNQPNSGARYVALIAGAYEMGLVEPVKYTSSALADGYSDGRGKTSGTYHGGNGCPFPDAPEQQLPCDWEWPYQSLQYSLSYENPNAPTTFEKMAWGSAPYYGAGPSLDEVYDTPTTSRPFNGYPASRSIRYSTCLVLGLTKPGGLTRSVAAGPAYNCAAAVQ